MLFCEHCKGIINDNEEFYEIHNRFYCKECVVDDIYNLEDSLKYCIEQVARNTKKENKSSIKHWEKRVEEKKKYLEEFLKATSTEGTLF
jgi:hypothetical protein